MSLANGATITDVVANGSTINQIYENGELVWDRQSPSGSEIFTAGGAFIVPFGYSEVSICMIGAGGAGVSGSLGGNGGGYAGDIVSQTITGLSSGQSITVTIGVGGASSAAAGSASSFGATSASGGAGGAYSATSTNTPYLGNGASRVTCGGTYNDGTRYYFDSSNIAWGGQAGFGNGGSCNPTTGVPTSGGVGAGGGASFGNPTIGSGGRGECRVTWTRDY